MTEKHSILIVDDDVSILETLSDVLQIKGYSVAVAENGSKAIDQVKEAAFDVVLLDVIMPGMNGVEAFREIRRTRPGIVAIMMTGYAVDDLLQEAIEEGVTRILRKPLDLTELLQLIESVCSEDPVILLVDDDQEFCQAMKDVLAHKGYNVFVANDGDEAVKIAREIDFDVIFIDMKLPTINGLETYLSIRKLNHRAVAIMMTGYRGETEELVQEAIGKNAVTCLYKPFAMEEALELLELLDGGEGGSTVESAHSR